MSLSDCMRGSPIQGTSQGRGGGEGCQPSEDSRGVLGGGGRGCTFGGRGQYIIHIISLIINEVHRPGFRHVLGVQQVQHAIQGAVVGYLNSIKEYSEQASQGSHRGKSLHAKRLITL